MGECVRSGSPDPPPHNHRAILNWRLARPPGNLVWGLTPQPAARSEIAAIATGDESFSYGCMGGWGAGGTVAWGCVIFIIHDIKLIKYARP